MGSLNECHSVALGHLPRANWPYGVNFQIRYAKALRKIISAYAHVRRHIPHVKTLDLLGHHIPRTSTLGMCAKPCIPLPTPQNWEHRLCRYGCLANHW